MHGSLLLNLRIRREKMATVNRNKVRLVTLDQLGDLDRQSLELADQERLNAFNEVFKRISVGAAYHVKMEGDMLFVRGSNLEHPLPQL